jgi:ubiquitin carboxyl-terminal hydrolase 5/13
MACGHLGCGRKNWDGSGGNNHAVDHYQSHNHPVVCKLGTITPEGNACKLDLIKFNKLFSNLLLLM